MGVTRLTMDGALEPTGQYSTLAMVEAGETLIWLSGQVGRGADGSMPREVRGQTLGAFQRIADATARIDLDLSGLVHLRTYLVGRSGVADFSAARDEVMAEWFGAGPAPASTLLIVSGLADPDAHVEIEAVVVGKASSSG